MYLQIAIYEGLPIDLYYLGTQVFFKESNSIFQLELKNGIKKVVFKSADPFVIESGGIDCLIIRDRKKISSLKNEAINTVFEFKENAPRQIKYIDDNWIAMRLETIDDNWKFELIRIKDGKVVVEIDNDDTEYCFMQSLQRLINCSKNKIVCIPLVDFKLSWKLNCKQLSDKACSQKTLLIFENKIFSSIEYEQDYTQSTFVLDFATGKAISEIVDFSGMLQSSDRIYFVFKQKLKILDCSSLMVTEVNLSRLLTSLDLFIVGKAHSILDNKLYFTAGVGDNTLIASYIGVIDLQEMKLEWVHELLQDNTKGSDIENRYSIINLRVTDNFIFTYCAGNSLHVFEKER